MNKIIVALCFLFVLGGAIFVPAYTFAQEPGNKGYHLIQPCADGEKPLPGSGTEFACGFTDLMELIDRIITLLLYVAVVLSIISFVYAGYLLLFSGGNEEALKHAKHIFMSVLVGLVLAYGAWIIVRFVLVSLGVKKGQDYTLIEGIE